MSNSQHGGRRPGSGRKQQKVKLPRGTAPVVERETIGGTIQRPELRTVLSVGGDDGNIIEFQCGDDIIVFRPPDD